MGRRTRPKSQAQSHLTVGHRASPLRFVTPDIGMMNIKCSSRLLSRFPTAIDGHYCPSTALAQHWGLYIDHSTTSQRYTTPLRLHLDLKLRTNTLHRRSLVDSDQGSTGATGTTSVGGSTCGPTGGTRSTNGSGDGRIGQHHQSIRRASSRANRKHVRTKRTNTRAESSSPRPAPLRHEERPLSQVREHPRRNNRSPPPRNNRSPPRRNNRSPPPRNGEAVVRGGNTRPPPRRESPGSGDERHRGPLSRRIMDVPLPRGLEKPPSLDKYDGTTDPDEHIQSELCRMFITHFTTSRRHPKTVANLKAIIQGLEEPLRSYIERFNKVAVEVDATDKMKLYLLEDGLREGTNFQEAVGIVEMVTLDEFFELAQRYIKWEENRKPPKSEGQKIKKLDLPRKEKNAEEKKRKGIVEKSERLNHQRDAIEILIQKGYARQYVEGQPRTTNNPPRQPQLAIEASSPEKNVEEDNRVVGGVALAISRPEDFLPLPSWENFPGALVISGGGFNPVTIGSIKRKFDELEKASLVGEIKITEVKESSVPLAFYREEVPGGSPNFQIPLLVRAKMTNFDVRRILVDQGSSCDIMYSGLFKVLQLPVDNLVPYVGSDLQGFNGSTTKPWGYLNLIVTFGENKAMKSVATINGDIEAARRCFEAAFKNLNFVVTPKKKKEEAKLLGVNSISTEDAVELDARTNTKERKQQKKAMKDNLLIKENYHHITDGEFELVPLGEDPTKGIKIGADLPYLFKRQMKACLRENAELFAWSGAQMPGIDPEVACHQLTIDPRASVVVQRRRKQSPEKAEAAKKAVKDLLEANFIAEAQYTT
ncbi:hypothetical protein TSUD_158540 [Trifolium subterraneum]|uniref:Retrotransposon gag domain-containing protein n=1 Tax=Trifolium subterraneum TaxID=3900 RepID=A0A2Z6N9I3_TRISU|nr:hypothetical protein TSUD_158540 [Trifolium subterraneum]